MSVAALFAGCVAVPVGQSPAGYYDEHQEDYWALLHPPQDVNKQKLLIVGFYPGQRYLDTLQGVESGAKTDAGIAATLINLGLFGAWIPVTLVANVFFDSDSNSESKQFFATSTLLGYVKANELILQRAEFEALRGSVALDAVFADFDPTRSLREYARRFAERADTSLDKAYLVTAGRYAREGFIREALTALEQAEALRRDALALSMPTLTDTQRTIDFTSFPAADRKLSEGIALLEAHESRRAPFYGEPQYAFVTGHILLERSHLLAQRTRNRHMLALFAPQIDNEEVKALARIAVPADDHRAVVNLCERARQLVGRVEQPSEQTRECLRQLVEVQAESHFDLASDCLARQRVLEADEHRQSILKLLPAEHPIVAKLKDLFETSQPGR